MDKLRGVLKQEIGNDAAEQRLLAAITKDYELIERDPPPDRSFTQAGVTCDVWRRGDMWQIKADGLTMNVEGHWSEDAVNAYAAEQLQLKGARRG